MTTFDKNLIRAASILMILWALWSFLGGPTWLGLLIQANQRAAVAEEQLRQGRAGKSGG